MNRRLLILGTGVLAVAAATGEALAQQVSGLPRVGVLHLESPERAALTSNEFRDGMRSLGWIDGATVIIEDRFASGDPVRLAANAAEFVAAKVDVRLPTTGASPLPAPRAPFPLPVVMAPGD